MSLGGLEAAAASPPYVESTSTRAGRGPRRTSAEQAGQASADVLRMLPTSRATAPGAPAGWPRRVSAALVAADLASAAIGAGVGYVAVTRSTWADVATAGMLPLAWVAVAQSNRAYAARFAGIGTTLFGRTLRTFVQLCIAMTFLAFFSGDALSRPFAEIALPTSLAMAEAARLGVHVWLRRQRAAGRALVPALALGSLHSVLSLADSVNADPHSGLRVDAACLLDHDARDARAARALSELGIRVLGDLDSVRRAAVESRAQGVLVPAGELDRERLRRVAWDLEGTAADLFLCTGLTEICGPRLHVQSVGGAALLRVEQPQFDGFRRVAKAVFDRVAAVFALLLLAPLLFPQMACARRGCPCVRPRRGRCRRGGVGGCPSGHRPNARDPGPRSGGNLTCAGPTPGPARSTAIAAASPRERARLRAPLIGGAGWSARRPPCACPAPLTRGPATAPADPGLSI